MAYHIVHRVNTDMTETEVGYVPSIAMVDQINAKYKAHYNNWFAENLADIESGAVSVEDYFIANQPFYKCGEFTTKLESKLPEIWDINNIE